MATIPTLSLRLSNPFPLLSSSPKTHVRRPPISLMTRATDPQTPASDSEPSESSSQPESGSDTNDDTSFEKRMTQFRLRNRSGIGKKAELRKVKKSKKGTSGSGVYLPPIPLKEPVSGGLKVDLGFSPYSERINGRVAILGLSALLLVELATGKSVINYHTPAIVLIQIYFVAAVAALYVKYEKERISVWPPQSSSNE
ncbi:FKBP-type peptidyl-prolyl cis-trans isomerase [Quillaja saponaria]|uniref:FKBP-type peptidyl-prolyl cis-trans isomerase n=1 Tax=Quillaja saponaria TaxID=32244 RepID=A0AAD7Q7D6_QUISA|nr:FKBP-type peptidyl-prolyl cis-trans isomerase [Quillaja saponaria]